MGTSGHLFREVERVGRDLGERPIRINAVNGSLVVAYGRRGYEEKDDACDQSERILRWGSDANGYGMTK